MHNMYSWKDLCKHVHMCFLFGGIATVTYGSISLFGTCHLPLRSAFITKVKNQLANCQKSDCSLSNLMTRARHGLVEYIYMHIHKFKHPAL